MRRLFFVAYHLIFGRLQRFDARILECSSILWISRIYENVQQTRTFICHVQMDSHLLHAAAFHSHVEMFCAINDVYVLAHFSSSSSMTMFRSLDRIHETMVLYFFIGNACNNVLFFSFLVEIIRFFVATI